MKKNKNSKKTCIPISSDCIQIENTFESIPFCEEDKLTDILSNIDELLNELLLDKECLRKEIDYKCFLNNFKNIPNCNSENKKTVLIEYFNFIFNKFCEIDDKLKFKPLNLEFELDWCKKDEYLSCEIDCLFENNNCDSNKKTLEQILSKLVFRANTYHKRLCEIEKKINNLVIPDVPDNFITELPKLSFICSKWNEPAQDYINYPNNLNISEYLQILENDYCKYVNSIGNIKDFNTLETDCIYANEYNLPSLSNSINFIDYVSKLKKWVCESFRQIQIINTKLEWCCKLDCEKCLDTYFEINHTNYGSVIINNEQPYISLNINTNLNGDNCPPQLLDINASTISLNDGVKNVILTFAELNIPSDNIILEDLKIYLNNLGLSYLNNIIIRLNIVTNLNCSQNFRILVPKYINPDFCKVCTICLKNNSQISGQIKFLLSSNKNPNTIYTLVSNNPCITINVLENEILNVEVLEKTNDDFYLNTDCTNITGEIKNDCNEENNNNSKSYYCYEFNLNDYINQNNEYTKFSVIDNIIIDTVINSNNFATEVFNILINKTELENYCFLQDENIIKVCHDSDSELLNKFAFNYIETISNPTIDIEVIEKTNLQSSTDNNFISNNIPNC